MKLRADQALVEAGLVESRERAKRLIMAGQVLMDAGAGPVPVGKPGQPAPDNATFSLVAPERYVSRGAYKLETAIEAFNLDVQGKTCLDVGASTGGFTDCLLQNGAAKVYAVDVGYGLLHEKLRNDPRVVSLERVNMRKAEPGLVPEAVDLLTMDVSFISARKVLPACLQFMKNDALAVVLVKPQFELGPGQTDKGVVHSEELQRQAVALVEEFAQSRCGMQRVGVVPSKVKGPKGNQEYAACFVRRT
ncbi:MAG: rRNA (cytidine1920-2-O)/16S rRNA (cytidine1409-2-O)-methyltransferase [Desulfovibrionales bacterium]|nr:rRNA (cytidine1920-2-O)/16S rRNA (cytidine1409-2-O)-methyltransferase [Desulfovibrionales bacterium]